jgi:hypothetical protein
VIVNYPDKQGKHYPLAAGPVTITWTWGGIKQITVEQTAGDQFSYIVLHVTDRDGGECSTSKSLHPVLGELVDWLIDSGDGTITDGEILISLGILGQSATDRDVRPGQPELRGRAKVDPTSARPGSRSSALSSTRSTSSSRRTTPRATSPSTSSSTSTPTTTASATLTTTARPRSTLTSRTWTTTAQVTPATPKDPPALPTA